MDSARQQDLAAFLEGHDVRRVLVPRDQIGHVGAARSADELAGDQGVVDGAGVDRVEVGVEEVAALLEEGTPFGVEQREGGVDIDLGRVGLDLAEIRVVGPLGGDAAGDVPRGAHAEFAGDLAIVPAVRVARAGLRGDHRRQQRQPLARLQTRDAVDGAPLAGPALLVAVVGGPGVLAADLARMVAPEVHAPDLLGPVGKTQAGQRDRDLDLPALRRDPARAGEDHLVAGVLAVARRPQEIALDAQRIAGDLVGPRLVAVGVQRRDDVVVLVDVVALAEAGADQRRVVVADVGDVDVGLVVRQHGLGGHRRLHLITRVVLGEIPRSRHALPARIVEQAVDLDGPGGGASGQVREIRGRPGVGARASGTQEVDDEERRRRQALVPVHEVAPLPGITRTA